ncbi:MAG TPA: glycoside hydrolase family 3 N-terminal domain-containing protein [Asanoa sp.]
MASPRCRRTLLPALVAVATLLAAAGCSRGTPKAAAASPSPAPVTAAPTPAASPAPQDPAAQAAALVATLSDEDLVGQVLMPYAYGSSATTVSGGSAAGNRKLAGVDTPAQMIARYRLGGLILVGFSADDPTGANQPTTNVDNAEQVRDLTAGLQKAGAALKTGGVPLLVGTDQEFGVVTRIKDGVTLLPSAMAIGAAGDPVRTEKGWNAAGAELAALGVNVDFAPDADVLGTAGGVIGSRSFGGDPKAVAAQVAAAVRGLQGAGVAATLKHFPGHGATATDSHSDLPVLHQDLNRLEAVDLAPFSAGIDAGAWLVMSGHLDAQAIDPGVSATFSHKVLTDVLRGRLRFTGVTVSDAMNMAPAEKYAAGDAAVRALNAGNDILLMPPNLEAAYDGIRRALASGTMARSRLVEAATRILTLKYRLAAAPSPGAEALDSAEHRAAAAELSAAAITQLRGPCGARLRGPVTVTASGGREASRSSFEHALRAAGLRVVSRGGAVVHLVGYGDGGGDLRADATVTVAMDTPYVLGRATSGILLASYSSTPASLNAVARVLAGKAKPTGRSPVTVPGLPRTVC